MILKKKSKWKLVGILMVVSSVIIVQVDKLLPLNKKDK